MKVDNPVLDLFKVAEIELIYKGKGKYSRPTITSADEAYLVLQQQWDNNKIELVEQFKIILLDTNGECLGIAEIATGSITSCLVDVRLIFATALKSRAVSLILAHNHPSGALLPSKADIQLTKRLMDGGAILDVMVADHLIMGRNGYYSFTNEKVFPAPGT